MAPSAKAVLDTVIRCEVLGAGTDVPSSSPHPEASPTAAAAATNTSLRCMGETLAVGPKSRYRRHGPVTANVVPGV